MNATIKDVAKHANVSIATVSRIINKKPGFSLETEQKVLEAIQTLGYRPNALARGLINKDTQTIGVLFLQFPLCLPQKSLAESKSMQTKWDQA